MAIVGELRGFFAAVDVHYEAACSRSALVATSDPAYSHVVAERTVLVPQRALPYQPGQFYLRELPALRAVFDGIGEFDGLDQFGGLALVVVDGYVNLDPAGRPGLGAHVHREFGVPVIGVAKSAYRTATHAIAVRRGTSTRPLFVTAAGLRAEEAASLVRRMSGRFRLPDALRRADTLARSDQ